MDRRTAWSRHLPANVHVFMNEKSGSCLGRREEIEAAFGEHGVRCEVTLIHPGMDLGELVRRAAQDAGTIVVAAGGDGTVSGVAAALAGTSTCMGVLPLGTLNHFAKDLGLPDTLEGAVRAIAEGSPQRVDVGEVNGRVFVNNSSLGFYPGMVRERERMKRVGWNKWFSLSVASIAAFLRFRHITVRLTLQDGSRPVSYVTPFLFIGNNEYAMEGANAGSRSEMGSGRIYLYMAPNATRFSMLALAVASLRGKMSEADHFESLCVKSCSIEMKRRHTRVALDGEVIRMETPLAYRIRPAALHVMTLAGQAEPAQ